MSNRRQIYFTVEGNREQAAMLEKRLRSLCNEQNAFRSSDFVQELEKSDKPDCHLNVRNAEGSLKIEMLSYGNDRHLLFSQYIHKEYNGLRAYFLYENAASAFIQQYVRSEKGNGKRWRLSMEPFAEDSNDVFFVSDLKAAGEMIGHKFHRSFRTKRELMKFIAAQNPFEINLSKVDFFKDADIDGYRK